MKINKQLYFGLCLLFLAQLVYQKLPQPLFIHKSIIFGGLLIIKVYAARSWGAVYKHMRFGVW